MKVALICLLGVLPCALYAETYGNCDNPFHAPVSPGTELSMTLRSGEVTIEGSDAAAITVTCRLKGRERPEDVRISFVANHLTVRGGDHDGVEYRIEIPRSMHLRVKCTAGDLSISGVTGNKEVSLNAGDLRIAVGDPNDYREVEASVLAGDISAPAFGASRDGLFRKLRRHSDRGRYRLTASLLAGDLTLR